MGGSFRAPGWNFVFTDGSCFCQATPAYRLASWAAVLAPAVDQPWLDQSVCVLGAGPVPGICQTAYRGELFALAFVLHHAAAVGARVQVFCDCKGVINKFHRVTAGNTRVRHNSASADLWTWVVDSVDRLGLQNIKLVKTGAHRGLAQSRSRQDAWEIWHNNKVDGVAKQANLHRSSAFWQCWEQHVHAVKASATLHQQVVQFHLAVARRSARSGTETDVVVAPTPRPPREFALVYTNQFWDGHLPSQVVLEYGAAMANRLVHWWLARTTEDSVSPVKWITCAHLYVDYQIATGCPGPIKHGTKWLDYTTRRYMEPEKHPFLHRLKWFRRMLKFFWKHTGHEVGLAQCRGEGESILSFINCGSVPWCMASWSGAEHWLLKSIGQPCLRGSGPLQALPIAAQQPRYALPDPKVVLGINVA